MYDFSFAYMSPHTMAQTMQTIMLIKMVLGPMLISDSVPYLAGLYYQFIPLFYDLKWLQGVSMNIPMDPGLNEIVWGDNAITKNALFTYPFTSGWLGICSAKFPGFVGVNKEDVIGLHYILPILLCLGSLLCPPELSVSRADLYCRRRILLFGVMFGIDNLPTIGEKFGDHSLHFLIGDRFGFYPGITLWHLNLQRKDLIGVARWICSSYPVLSPGQLSIT